MAQQGLIDEAIVCLQKTPQIPADNEGNLCESIWNELNQLNSLNETNIDTHAEIKQEVAQEYFRLTSRYKIITHTLENSDDRKYLEKMGLSLANVRLIAQQDNFLLEEIYIKSFADSPKHLHQPVKLSFPYQQVLVETGYVYAVCPFSGKIIRSNQSFVINHQEVGHHDLQGFLYRFVGREIFYLMTGCPRGEKLLIYIPRLELIINLNPALVGLTRPVESINKLKSYMVSYWQQVKTYLANDQKKVVDIVGLGFNIGHYLWQDVTGIDVILKNGMSQNIDVIIGDGEYFSIGDIFSEIKSENLNHVKDVWNAFKMVLDKNYVAFRANGFFIEEELINKVCQVAWTKCSEDVVQEVAKAKNHFPLISIQIRTSSRVWLGQVEGIANIIKTLYTDFPNLGIVFDGWSLTGKEDSLSTSWSIIEREKAIMEEILAIIPSTINTYSAIGATTYETIVWNLAIDLSLSPLGAGLMYPSWIANKPSVVYADTIILKNFEFAATSSSFRENIVPPVLVPKEYIVDSSNHNYECDWKGIYTEAMKILRNLLDN
jgi:hypothetical protein